MTTFSTLTDKVDAINGRLDLPHGDVVAVTVYPVSHQPDYVIVESPLVGDRREVRNLHVELADLYLGGMLAALNADMARATE